MPNQVLITEPALNVVEVSITGSSTPNSVAVTETNNEITVNTTSGGGGGTITNLSSTADSTTVTVQSSDGTNATLSTASGSVAGILTSTLWTRLNGVEDGATADQTNAEIRAAVEAAIDSNVFTDVESTKVLNLSGTNTGDQTITLTGDVTGTGTGSFAATIASAAITGQTDLGAAFADADSFLVHDQTASALREGTMENLKSYVEAVGGTSILVSMPATVGGVTPTFGKFKTGDTINVSSTTSALDIIKAAVQSAADLQNPASVTGISSIPFKLATETTSVSRTIECDITNPNKALGTSIDSVALFRKLGSASYGTAIETLTVESPGTNTAEFASLNNEVGTSGTETFTFSEDAFTHTHADSSGVSDDYTYQIVVTDSAADTGTTETTMTNTNYSKPTVGTITPSRINTSSAISSNESNILRERGNTRSSVGFTISQSSSNVGLTGYKLERSVGDGSWDEVSAVDNTVFESKTVTDNYDSTSAAKIEYRVQLKDEQNTSYGNIPSNESSDINLRFPYIVGGAPAAARTTLTAAHVTDAITQNNIQVILTTQSLPDNIANFTADNDGNPAAGAYLLIAYPGTTAATTFVNAAGENLFGSITKMSGSGITITPNTGFDVNAAGDYTVYVSNAGGAFDNQTGLNIG